MKFQFRMNHPFKHLFNVLPYADNNASWATEKGPAACFFYLESEENLAIKSRAKKKHTLMRQKKNIRKDPLNDGGSN